MKSLEEPVEELVDVNRVDFKLEPRTEGGMMVLNPPYGEHMDPGDVVGLYEQVETPQFHWPDSTWIVVQRRGAEARRRRTNVFPCSMALWSAVGRVLDVQRQQSRRFKKPRS